MAHAKKPNDYGTGIPYHKIEAFTRVPLPEIQAFFESEEGRQEFAKWKAKQQAEQKKQAFSIEMINPNTFPIWRM